MKPLFYFNWIVISIFIFSNNLSIAQEKIPVRADKFVDYMGVGATFGSDYGKYDEITYFGLEELGVRYIRGWMNWLDHDNYGVRDFKDLGIRMCGLWQDPRLRKALKCRDKVKTVGVDFFIAIEGHNEPDIFSKKVCLDSKCNDTDNKIFDASILHQQLLYDDLKSDIETSSLPVVAFSMAKIEKIESAISQKCDIRNLHYYPKWINGRSYPTSGAYFGGVQWNDVLTRSTDYNPDAGIYITESGHNIREMSEKAQAKYIGRTFAEYFNSFPNIEKLFYFRLHQKDAGNTHDKWGLMGVNGNRFKSFYALKSLIETLQEASYNTLEETWELPNPNFEVQPINLTFTSKTESTHDLLLQKGDGTYYLLLWQEVNSYNWETKRDLNPELDRITVEINGIHDVEQYTYNESNFEYTANPISVINNSITVNVPDHITIIRFSKKEADLDTPEEIVGDFKVMNKEHQKFLTAKSRNRLRLENESSNNNQIWEFIKTRSGDYVIKSKRYASVLDGDPEKRVKLNRTASSKSDKKWQLEKIKNESYFIKNKALGKWLDGDKDFSVDLHQLKDKKDHKWTLIKLSSKDKTLAESNLGKIKNKIDYLIAPNPTNGIININTQIIEKESEDIKVGVFDFNGRYISEIKIKNNQIDISNYPAGIYFIQIQIQGRAITEKIMLK